MIYVYCDMQTLVILMYWFTSVPVIVDNSSFNVNVFHEYFGLGITRIRSSHRRCSTKKVFLKISPNLHGNTCARVSFLIKLQVEFREIHTKTLFHSTPLGDYFSRITFIQRKYYFGCCCCFLFFGCLKTISYGYG